MVKTVVALKNEIGMDRASFHKGIKTRNSPAPPLRRKCYWFRLETSVSLKNKTNNFASGKNH